MKFQNPNLFFLYRRTDRQAPPTFFKVGSIKPPKKEVKSSLPSFFPIYAHGTYILFTIIIDQSQSLLDYLSVWLTVFILDTGNQVLLQKV